MKNTHLSREDYEALVFSDIDRIPTSVSEEEENDGPEILTLTGDDGIVRNFFPLGVFTVNDDSYMMVCDADHPEGGAHMIRFAINHDETVDFYMLTEEEFQSVMEDFENFMTHLPPEEEE